MTRPVEFAQILLQCLKEALDTGPAPVPAEKVCLRFGQEVRPMLGTNTDECCTGLAWTRVAGILPTRSPEEVFDEDGECAHVGRRLTLEMGTARCAPSSDVSTVPTCDAWTVAALQMDADQQAMETALCCFRTTLGSLPFEPRATPGEYQPIGPDGNCILGTMQVIVDYECGCGSA